jgi:hypothetical protein
MSRNAVTPLIRGALDAAIATVAVEFTAVFSCETITRYFGESFAESSDRPTSARTSCR